MKTKEEIKERLIELYYYLSQVMLKEDLEEINNLRLEIDNLIKEYLNVIKK